MKHILSTGPALVVLSLATALATFAQTAEWKTVTSPDRSFRIELPTSLKEVGSFEGEHGAILATDQAVYGAKFFAGIETTPRDSRFGIIAVDGRLVHRSAKLTRSDLIEYLAAFYIGDDDESQFLKPPTVIKQHGLRGNEFFYVKESTANGITLYTRGRIFDLGGKTFIIVFVGRSEADLKSPDAERFLDSFRVNSKR